MNKDIFYDPLTYTGSNTKVYECDAEKNINCKKNDCYLNGGNCHQTFHKEFSKLEEK